MSDFPFSVLTVSDANVELGEIERKDMGYFRDNIRCIFLLTDKERTNTYLARCLLTYPVDNILCALVCKMINGKTHEEIPPVVGMETATPFPVIESI